MGDRIREYADYIEAIQEVRSCEMTLYEILCELNEIGAFGDVDPDDRRGLYSKYVVTKDGKPIDGDCFVLRPDRDEAAREALRAYATHTRNQILSQDIRRWLMMIEDFSQNIKEVPHAES